jgi:hypothetical protein
MVPEVMFIPDADQQALIVVGPTESCANPSRFTDEVGHTHHHESVYYTERSASSQLRHYKRTPMRASAYAHIVLN